MNIKNICIFLIGTIIGIWVCLICISSFFNIKNIPDVVMTTHNEIVEIKDLINSGFNCNLPN